MAFEGEHGIVAHHAAAVVGDLDQLFATSFDVDLDASRACVERVLEQLFYHRGRALHHLAGGDFVGYVLGEYVDAAHDAVLGSQFSVLSCCGDRVSFADGEEEGKDSGGTEGGASEGGEGALALH